MVLPIVNNSANNGSGSSNSSSCTNNVLKTLVSKKGVMMTMLLILCVFVIAIPPEPLPMQDTRNMKDLPEPVRLREDGYRLCQAFTGDEGDVPVLGDPMIKLPKLVAPMGIAYQCAGPDYEAFGDRLQSLLQEKTRTATHSSSNDPWGKRIYPIPPHAGTATTTAAVLQPTFVLFFGTTALRQVVAAMLCQYSHLIASAKKIYVSKRTNHGSFSIRVVLRGNIHIFIVLNPPFVYDHEHWQDLLERHVLNMPLAVMDIIIMSRFNAFSKQQGLAYEEFWMDHENDWTLPDTVHQDPISFMDLLVPSEHSEGNIVYTGPIVYVSLFASYGESEYKRVVETIDALREGQPLPRDTHDSTNMVQFEHEYEKAQKLAAAADAENQGLPRDAEDRLTYKAPPPKTHPQGRRRQRRRLKAKATHTGSSKRTNLVAIDARQYVSSLGECATNQAEQVGTCLTDVTHEYYDKGERCLGTKGGHADLVAFDVVEAIYKVMWEKK
jgi:hypothetical protein